jgi:predicted dehydrogenase
MLILACDAGKDVYLQKPVMYRVGKAKATLDAVRRNSRIVQVGTQQRSADHIAEAG